MQPPFLTPTNSPLLLLQVLSLKRTEQLLRGLLYQVVVLLRSTAMQTPLKLSLLATEFRLRAPTATLRPPIRVCLCSTAARARRPTRFLRGVEFQLRRAQPQAPFRSISITERFKIVLTKWLPALTHWALSPAVQPSIQSQDFQREPSRLSLEPTSRFRQLRIALRLIRRAAAFRLQLLTRGLARRHSQLRPLHR